MSLDASYDLNASMNRIDPRLQETLTIVDQVAKMDTDEAIHAQGEHMTCRKKHRRLHSM